MFYNFGFTKYRGNLNKTTHTTLGQISDNGLDQFWIFDAYYIIVIKVLTLPHPF